MLGEKLSTCFIVEDKIGGKFIANRGKLFYEYRKLENFSTVSWTCRSKFKVKFHQKIWSSTFKVILHLPPGVICKFPEFSLRKWKQKICNQNQNIRNRWDLNLGFPYLNVFIRQTLLEINKFKSYRTVRSVTKVSSTLFVWCIANPSSQSFPLPINQ